MEAGANVGVAHRFAGTTAMHFAAEMGRADVILALDWVDLKGYFELTLGKGAEVKAKVGRVGDGFAVAVASAMERELEAELAAVEARAVAAVTPLEEAARRREEGARADAEEARGLAAEVSALRRRVAAATRTKAS